MSSNTHSFYPVVFAENDVCCWVDRVFEGGNAATASIGDKLQRGDQLAALDGVTAMRKNVSEVCKMLANAADPNIIELTFVRYVGAIHPASKEQQGYEVIDTKLSKEATGRFSPINLARKISFSRPRTPQPTSEKQEVIKIKSNKVVSTMQSSKPPKPEPIAKQEPQEKVTVDITSKQESAVPRSADTKLKEKKKLFGFLRKGDKKQNSKKDKKKKKSKAK
jgi:hypothetical protein